MARLGSSRGPRRERRRVIRSAAALFGVAVFVVGMSSAFATHVEPTTEEFPGGEPICGDGQTGFRINDPGTGAYNDGTLYVDIDIANPEPVTGPEFDWSIDFGAGKTPLDILVVELFVKGGTIQSIYDYSGQPGGGEDADTGLHSPLNDNNQKWFGLSHVDFCYGGFESRGSIAIIKDTVPDGPAIFAYTVAGGALPAQFDLDDNGNNADAISNTQFLVELSPDSEYVVTESLDAAFTQSVACVGGGDDTSTEGRVATIGFDEAEQIVCTFTNTETSVAGTTQTSAPDVTTTTDPGVQTLPRTGSSTTGLAGIAVGLIALGLLAVLARFARRPQVGT